jgi:hypothetical protein
LGSEEIVNQGTGKINIFSPYFLPMVIPFIQAKGANCVESIIKMVLQAKGVYPVDNELQLRRRGKRLHPIQIANYIAGTGIKTVLTGYKSYINKGNVLRCIKEYYGKYAYRIIRQTSFDDLYLCFEKQNPNLELASESIVTENISNYSLLIVLMNYDLYIGRENQFRGHYILLTEISSRFINYSDPGPMNASPNRSMPINKLETVWKRMSFLDDGIILIR